MTVCNFFLQGRCRYGDKCWNEHPKGGSRGGAGADGGYNNNYNRSSGQQQQPRRGGEGGGFGNRVWVNPSLQKGDYIQPSSFSSRGSDDWGRGGGGGGGRGGNDWGRGGGRRDNVKASDYSFSSQNRFAALGTQSAFDRAGRGGGQEVAVGDEDDDKKLEIIQMDMEIWESSGQWGFSCYSNFKTCLSGFTELSPEELRLEYYSARASGDLQGYMNGINQLLHQWRNRVQELKIMNPSTRAALLAEFNSRAPQTSSSDFNSTTVAGFGSSTSNFGSKGFGAPAPVQASSFSFAASGGGFGSSAAPGFGSATAAPTQPPSGFGSSAAPGFGSATAAPAQPPSGFGSSAAPGFGSATAAPTQPPSGFGSTSGASSALSASSFSFSAPTSSAPAATTGFGSASGFSFSAAPNAGGAFGSSFGAEAPVAAGSGSVFGQTSGGFGTTAASSTAAAAKSATGAPDCLYSPEDRLTPEELNQFKAKMFTLGQIPLKPPPANILMV